MLGDLSVIMTSESMKCLPKRYSRVEGLVEILGILLDEVMFVLQVVSIICC